MSVSHEQRITSAFTLNEQCVPVKKQVDIQNLLRKKDFKSVVKLLQHNKKSRLDYQKVKFQGCKYHLGQNICIRLDNKQEYVVKLIKIVKLSDDEDNIWPLIKVQQFCTKNQISGLTKDQLDCISENEVFKTEKCYYIEIECIVGLATILTYEEYDQIEDLNDNVYFSRATYMNGKLTPFFEQWKHICICQKPPNPDLKYILCDVCQIWCHLKCVKLTQDQADRLKSYTCPKCKN